MAIVTAWTPWHYELVWLNWFAPPRIYFVWAFPCLGLLAADKLMRSIKFKQEVMPLVCEVGLFLSGYLGLATSLYPFAIPPAITIWQAASQRETMWFILWGTIIILPFVIGYTSYSYAVFRGKVGEEGYH